jgi:prepilin-type N-terminal cleavage/methylation domain-containing protein
MKCDRVASAGRNREGFTLVEMMMAMLLFGILAAGLVSSVLQARRLAESTVFETTAHTAALGYLEQMKSLRYEALEALAGGEGGIIATRIDNATPDPLAHDLENEKLILVDLDEEGLPRRWLNLWVHPRIRDLRPNGIRALEIELSYRWLSPDQRRTHQSTVRYVRSWVDS